MTSSPNTWELLPFNAPILPVHAALLPPVNGGNAKILFLAGRRDEAGANCPNCSAVWDYTNGNSFSRSNTPLLSSGVTFDFFCSGHAFLSNGNLLIAGGTLQANPFLGLPDSIIFNSSTLNWEVQPSMAHGRWYPTLTRLGDERVIAISGKDENGLLNLVPEIYSPGTGWTAFSSPTVTISDYANIFLLSDGRLFSAGRANARPYLITLPGSFSDPIITTSVSGLTDKPKTNYTTSAAAVLLPPAQDQKIMIIGGYKLNGSATARVNVIDLKAANPTYQPAPYLNHARLHNQAVILPDRTVFVCGGSTVRNSIPDAVLVCEVYDPSTNTWTDVASHSIARLYHSIALLLPDGRVLLAGSNPPGQRELRMEIYSPSYMVDSRPVIDASPVEISYGQTISISTAQASTIQWVQLVRPSAVTHCMDVEQRLIDIPFTVIPETNSLSATIITNRNLAPSGWYMLNIVDDNRIPSVSTWVHLT
ncbi:MAG TPA: galactose oxidase-like domain-containing protein [Stenomitos sp.]